MPNLKLGPITKTSAAAAIAALTPADLTTDPSQDPTQLASEFAAAQTAATTLVAALTGPALYVTIEFFIYAIAASDPGALATPGTSGDRVEVRVRETYK